MTRSAPTGAFVAFESSASNLVAGDTNDSNDVFVRDRVAGTTERVSVSSDGAQANRTETAALAGDQRGRALRRLLSVASNLVAGDTQRLARTCSCTTG